ncbi:MAG: helix-turn-helix domain-containing protein [Alphaproteobacteria bacterium]
MTLSLMSIGELADQAHCLPETVRYYEKVGLLEPVQRMPSGHRRFDIDNLKRLVFLRRCRELGFSTQRMRELLTFVDQEEPECDDVRTIAADQLKEIRTRITDLRKMQSVLKRMIASCEQGALPECPIIETLYKAP